MPKKDRRKNIVFFIKKHKRTGKVHLQPGQDAQEKSMRTGKNCQLAKMGKMSRIRKRGLEKKEMKAGQDSKRTRERGSADWQFLHS